MSDLSAEPIMPKKPCFTTYNKRAKGMMMPHRKQEEALKKLVDEVTKPALRVWGVVLFARGLLRDRIRANNAQVRVIVAAKSRAAAARQLDITDGHLKTYGSVTGNAEEVALANARYPNASYRALDYKLPYAWFDAHGDRVAEGPKAKR